MTDNTESFMTVCLASSREAKAFVGFCDRSPEINVRSVVTGHANRLLSSSLKGIRKGDFLSAGFAGGLNPDWPPGTLILARRVVDRNSRRFLETNRFFRNSLVDALLSENISFREGTLVTSPRPVITTTEKQSLFREKWDAVDMESYGILEFLRGPDARVAVLRLISDSADETAEADYGRLFHAHSQKLSGALRRVSGRLYGLSPEASPCP